MRKLVDHIANFLKTRTESQKRFLYFFIYILPIIFYLSLVIRYSINVPFWDEWGTIDLYKALREGSLTLHQLWIPHNEHRSLLFYVIYLSIAWFSKFNAITPVYFGIAFKFITLFLIYDLIRLSLKRYSNIALLIILFSPFFVFAAQEGEVVFWGFASLLFNLGAFLTILTLWGLVRYQDRFLGVLIASLAAIGGSLVSANGLFLWGIGTLYILFYNLIRKKKLLSANLYYWLAVMAIFLVIYFYDYHAVNTGSTLSWILSHKKMSLLYFLAYMSSLTTYGSDNRAFLFGSIGLILLGINFAYYLLKRDFELLFDLMPWFLFPLYVLLVAVVTTAGRAIYGAWQAQSPRYVLMSYTYWLSLFILSSILLSNTINRTSLQQYMKTSLQLMIPGILFMVPILIAYKSAFTKLVPYWHDRFSVGLHAVYEYPYSSEEALAYVYPEPSVLDHYIKYLDENNLGPFAPGYRPTNTFLAHSVPLPDSESYNLDLSDGNVWQYQKIRMSSKLKNTWETRGIKPYFMAPNLSMPICINDYQYIYVEMAISDKPHTPREMQIYLQPKAQSSIADAYLLAVPIAVGEGLNAYSLDLQRYQFPQNTQINAIAIYPLGQAGTDKDSSSLTIQKFEFIKNKLPSSCN